MTSVRQLRNIGLTTAQWLESVGITTGEELSQTGVIEAYQLVEAAYPHRVTANLLYALQGALLDLPWNDLPPKMRAALKAQLGEARGA